MQQAVMSLDLSRIAQDLQIRKLQVESVVQLLDEGNTVPFITRYRKERTGGLNEEVIRKIQARINHLRQLADRKQTILKTIENQGKLTDELRDAILAADTSKRLEDLYLPYKPKKKSLASTARERGLEPLALAIWNKDPAVANLAEVLPTLVNPEKELPTPEAVREGVQHILAEQIAETADIRAAVRCILWETGKLLTSKSESLAADAGLEYKDYFEFSEGARQIPAHRILAINRGEKEGALKVRMEWDADLIRRALFDGVREHPPLLPLGEHPHKEFLHQVADDALARLLLPSLEREIRRELTDEAQEHAVAVFARNLRSLLLQPPLRNQRVLAVDPGFRTGCKVAVLDETGNILEHDVIYPHGSDRPPRREREKPAPAPAAAANAEAAPPPAAEQAPATGEAVPTAPPAEQPAAAPPVETAAPAPASVEVSAAPAPEAAPPAEPKPPEPPRISKREFARTKLEELIRKHRVQVIAIGNGTACRETEEFVSELIAKLAAPSGHGQETVPQQGGAEGGPPPITDLAYVIVNEAGASVYSASPVGREEFPDFDATTRGTISIGRRLQDPLSELVKIDPQNVGVGLYQHDVRPNQLKDSLEAVIESCVNHVGVDLNTASVPLLRHVAGLNQLVAREIVEFRKQNGPFKSREQLQQVPNIGPQRWVQAAGFLRVIGGENPLDNTWIHPESYAAARRLLEEMGAGVEALHDRQKVEELREKLKGLSPEEVATRLEVGVPTLHDIFEALGRPGRDPREDLPPPVFKKGILKLEDLQPNMELKGTVLNVVDFGAFVDIGLKDSGLVHISQMANRYVKNPYEVVAVGDVVTVWVLSVDQGRRRVSLTMIKPGTERKPPERKPPERPPAERRPPERRPPRPQQPQQQQQGRQGPPPRGQRRDSLPQRGTRRQVPGRAPAHGGAPAQETAAPAEAPRPRKPQPPRPLPKLSDAALKGKVPLRTFGELAAFYKEPTPPEPAPAAEPPKETPPAAAESAPAENNQTPAPAEPAAVEPSST